MLWGLDRGISHPPVFCTRPGQIGLAVVNQLLPRKNLNGKKIKIKLAVTLQRLCISVHSYFWTATAASWHLPNRQKEQLKAIKVASLWQSLVSSFSSQRKKKKNSCKNRLEGLQCLLVLLHDSQWPQIAFVKDIGTALLCKSSNAVIKSQSMTLQTKTPKHYYLALSSQDSRMKPASNWQENYIWEGCRGSLLSIIIWETIWNKTFKPQSNPQKTAYPLIN